MTILLSFIHYGGMKPWNAVSHIEADRIWWGWAAKTEFQESWYFLN